jgi:hypothetical protein
MSSCLCLTPAHCLQDQLGFNAGDNAVMHKLFDVYVQFLQPWHAQHVQQHAFAALRAFINKVSGGYRT